MAFKFTRTSCVLPNPIPPRIWNESRPDRSDHLSTELSVSRDGRLLVQRECVLPSDDPASFQANRSIALSKGLTSTFNANYVGRRR
ncbi:hypothetical protein BV898_18515 [Hypsibius exemplaris]|uniref:Uncharacterized protein n=1 Tax=Hypsibius exemplaris TaxID=2072580 RepID=A0A9X6RNJ9_HYPEX|nr:hypothetical protein BV898_18515 [Hypsibius exemplaris]